MPVYVRITRCEECEFYKDGFCWGFVKTKEDDDGSVTLTPTPADADGYCSKAMKRKNLKSANLEDLETCACTEGKRNAYVMIRTARCSSCKARIVLEYKCDIPHKTTQTWRHEAVNFCPNCGASMTGNTQNVSLAR